MVLAEKSRLRCGIADIFSSAKDLEVKSLLATSRRMVLF
ncbi:hypothetical protein DBT_0002 [Dissulfuribacter thermophilus]|uniref:Uncharacterized protein n=1 Tax=Dissulfuribacter thermophilus TaxID=1156395 RepID=A0A1B9F8P7_9BACT|nr:hypothetical protein DBT_0002 [Dissulfuribacter thermophilus]